jgi:polyphosphate kinase
VLDKNIAEELKDLLNIQLKDNVKARWLDNHLSNHYVSGNEEHKVRSQIEIYNYLHQKTLQVSEVVLEETQSLKGITTD